MAKKKSVSLAGITKKADIISALSNSVQKDKTPAKKLSKKKTPAKSKIGWSFNVREGDGATILNYHGPGNLKLTFLLLSLSDIHIVLNENQKDIHSVTLHSRGQNISFSNDEGLLKISTFGSKVQVSTFAEVKYDKSFHTVIDELSGDTMRNDTAKVVMSVL